jgi:hypothetical protein
MRNIHRSAAPICCPLLRPGMAHAISELLKEFNVEAATVAEQLGTLNARLFGVSPPSGRLLQRLLDEKHRLVEQDKLLRDRRSQHGRARSRCASPSPWPWAPTRQGPAAALLRTTTAQDLLCSFATGLAPSSEFCQCLCMYIYAFASSDTLTSNGIPML